MTEEEDEHSKLRRYADYLMKAEEADERASAARDEDTRNSFGSVAEGWRRLAEQVKRTLLRQ